MSEITVIKCNPKGEEVWRYRGQVLKRTPRAVLLEARFNRPDLLFNGMLLCQGDLFKEIYFSERGYNIFAIHDHQDRHLKGWYCNVTRPAVLGEEEISYVDLALDLLVFPDGRQLVLDEDEFAALDLTLEETLEAQSSLQELRSLFLQVDQFRMENLLDGGLSQAG